MTRAEDGTVTAAGGTPTVLDPWRIDEGTLTAIGFRYQIPAVSDGIRTRNIQNYSRE